MKQNNKALYGLLASHTIYKILPLCTLLALYQGYTILTTLKYGYFSYNLDSTILYSYFPAILLSLFFCSLHSTLKDATYSLKMLGTTNRQLFHALTLNNFSSLFILWGAQLLIIHLARIFFSIFTGDPLNFHLYYLDSWLILMFHFLLPTLDILHWLAIILFYLALSLTTATISMSIYTNRKRNKYYVLLLLQIPAFLAYCSNIMKGIIYEFFWTHFIFDGVNYSYSNNTPWYIDLFYIIPIAVLTLILFLGGKKYDKT